MVDQFADPAVSLAKFSRELEEFEALRHAYEERGAFLVSANFPEAYLVIGVPHLRPHALLFGLLFDYTNYDAAPPSVRLTDPFTRRPLLGNELPTPLPKAVPQVLPAPDGVGNIQLVAAQPLMQFQKPEDVPFLCIAGVREYHEHPGHTGDSWELHRPSGAGRIVRLLEVILNYGVEPIRGYGVNLVPQIGLDLGEPRQ